MNGPAVVIGGIHSKFICLKKGKKDSMYLIFICNLASTMVDTI